MTENIPWPDERWSIFSNSNPDPSSPTWCSLNWLRSSTFLDGGVLAGQFKRAADGIVEHRDCERDHLNPDGLFMPIAYLYRHALELQLKHLVGLACDAELIARSKRIDELLTKEHDLHRLWGHARKALETRWPEEPDAHILDNTEALILDFDIIDESGQNLRYSRDTTGKPTTTNYPEAVDLKDFKVAFDGVFGLLDACATEFAEIVDHIREVEREDR